MVQDRVILTMADQ